MVEKIILSPENFCLLCSCMCCVNQFSVVSDKGTTFNMHGHSTNNTFKWYKLGTMHVNKVTASYYFILFSMIVSCDAVLFIENLSLTMRKAKKKVREKRVGYIFTAKRHRPSV